MRATTDTIVAPATPPGKGALHVIRVSGPEATTIIQPFLGDQKVPTPGRHGLRTLVDPATGLPLDQALLLAFKAPHSLTGEDVVELHLHGSPMLRQELLTLFTRAGARLADPGEFTLRAFLNGKQDLTRAEAVHDLIEARSSQALRLAAQQLHGGLAKAIETLRDALLATATRLEAELDFPDDVDSLPQAELITALDQHVAELSHQGASLGQGQLWREGYRVVLVGPPNAGKSALFNALLESDRAIVTDEAGTTRDYLEEPLPNSAYPVFLVDTAGLRSADSLSEQAGVERSLKQVEEASLLLVLEDSSTLPNSGEESYLANLPDRPLWRVATKCDLPQMRPRRDQQLRLSAVSGEGLPELREGLEERAAAALGDNPPTGALTNLRQQDAVLQALKIMRQVQQDVDTLPRDILATEVRAALLHLADISGQRTVSEEILERIFSQFCIGK
jgi:tRNA modification GTPase